MSTANSGIIPVSSSERIQLVEYFINHLILKTTSIDVLAKKLWDFNTINQPLQKSDAILVLGSADIRIAHFGIDIFLKGWAPLLIFSGGVGKLTKDIFSKSEAETFADEAIRLGVPTNHILLETQSQNTGQNCLMTKEMLDQNGININSLIIIHKPYMLRRSYATFKKFWPQVKIALSCPPLDYENYPNDLINKDLLINLLVGDTQRVIEFPNKGFQIVQEVPSDIKDAMNELIDLGFDNHLIK